jgi:uncharacterized OB-fold protein
VTVFEPAGDVTLFGPERPGRPTALHASRCCACGRVAFPRRTSCPACGAGAEAIELSGPARLRVHTAVLAQPPGSSVTAPYDVGVAEFDEGICVIGLIDGSAARGDRVLPVVAEPYPGGRVFAFRRYALTSGKGAR